MSGVKKIYTSENQYLYDTARENNLFREEDYLLNKNAGTELEYLSAMIDTKGNISSSFDKALYDRLSGTDRFNYFVVENYSDHSSDEYKANVEYFKHKEQKIKQQEIYDGLTGLQKFGNTVGGLFDNALLQVHGLIENLIDAVPAAIGQIAGALGAEDVFESTKKFVAKDTTGYAAAQKEMNDWLSAYTILDKNWFGETLNNLTVAITRQLPTILGGAALTLIGGPAGAALSAVGTGIHYGAMYGASAEESYIANADIDAWSALKYSAGTVGLEAVTEWGSNLLFGASWFDPATGVAGKTVSSFGKDIWHDMWTEAVEESVSELFGSMLYKKYVDPTADTASITDILYAALLGAASGGLLSAAGGIAGTTKKSVYQGQIVDTSSLTTEQKKQANNLGFLKSYKLSKLSQLAGESLSQTTEVTKLQAKYTNLSLDQIKQQFPDQYADAVEQDATTTEIQTKQVLALAQFLSTIGEDSFRNAINVLNNNATAAREMVDNYLNRTDLYNKAAVVAFNTAFPDESYTPIKQPDNAEQELAKTVRMAFPNINVSFGVFGQKDGLAVKSVKSSGNWLFIESGLVSKKGYDYVLGQCIRQELANDVLTQLSELEPYLVDGLVSLITDEKTKYKDLPEEQKKTLAQLLCFDPVINRRAFLNNKKLHSKIFKSITNQADYVRRFGRQTEANKLRYHDLLVIRDTFLKSVAETIFNDTDVATVKNEYGLIDEELTTKITDKTVRTFLNENIRLTNINFAKQAILRTDATQEIMVNRLDEQGYVNFDWSRLYDKTYYKPEFITTVTTTEQSNDFAESLRKYLLVKYNTQFDLTVKDAILKFITDKTNNTDVTKLANTLFTNEFVQSVNKTVLQEELAEILYRLSQTESADQNADSIVITDNQIKGTGALSDFHMNIQLLAGNEDVTPETPETIVSTTNKKTQPKKSNLTDKDLEQLSSTSYKTGETRKSKTKGLEDVEYEVSYVMDYETHNSEILNKIKTLNDLRQVVNAIKEGKITGVEAAHLLNLLQAEVIPFNFDGDESAMQLIKPLLKRNIETAQEFASRSELFAETHPVENLVNELTEKFGEKINVPEDVVVKWVPYYADRKNYLKQIKNEYQELRDKRDHTDDPYLKQQYTIKLKDLRTLAKMVVDENTAGVLDYYMSELKNSDTDKVENNEKIQDITKDLVTALVQHTDMSSLKPKYDPTKKSILKPEHAQKLANFWETVNGFRYLALLSSPATWGRNAITNTLISVNAIVEDTLSGMIEKTRLLRAESQASYTGDYDQEFSEFIDEEFAPEVEKDTSGDKYNTTELEAIKREYAIENDPMKKHEILYKIKEFEQKMLNDKPWTKRRVLRNLKNTLAGSINMISNNVYGELKALYHGDNAAEILANMRKTNSPLADLFEQVFITNNNDDMIGVIKLAKQLPSSSQVVQEIYDNALYRGNKLLFKTENFLTKRISSLKKSHPAVAGFLSLFIPFARTSWNTSAYIVNHSPVGLIKGIIKGLQTRNMYIGDMRQEITNHYKNEYIKQNKKPNANFEFSQKKFDEWLSKNVSGDIVAAINGDTKSIKAVFDTMAEQGLVNSSLIGSNDIFARANTIESISQGLTGTAMLALGLILGALCEGFKIDEDDYLGPVLTVGNVRIKLSDLSPYATMFSVGAIVNSSDSVLDAFGNFASIMVDASMLNVIESAIQYSDGVVDYLGNQSINIVQQFIPAIFKSVTKTIDNAKKDKSGNYFERLYKTTFANTPLFSYLVANKIDPYTGETEKIYQSGFLEALWHNVSPIGTRTVVMSDMEREARALGVGTTGLTGRFTINEVDYTVKNKEKYAKYRAEYIEKQFTDIFNNKQKVTVEESNGKRITTTYDKLTDEQKKNVIERLYTEASAMTKIKWWIDAGNKYVVTDRDTYTKYRTLFDSANIVYKTTWTKSKFVEA